MTYTLKDDDFEERRKKVPLFRNFYYLQMPNSHCENYVLFYMY